MKKIVIALIILASSFKCMAQQSDFPFQGGKIAMNRFFRDTLVISPDIIQRRATGTVIIKFTANGDGKLSKIIIYYADDARLAAPVITALKLSVNKWVLPGQENTHDYIISFVYKFNPPGDDNPDLEKAVLDYYIKRKPIVANNQVPLDAATLLPAVILTYDIQ